MLETAVAKKAPKKKVAATPDAEMREELIAVRCTARYKAWAKEFARNELVTPTQLVAIALKQLAETRRFKLPPDR